MSVASRGLFRRALRGAMARPALLRRACRDAVCVFLYHDVTDAPAAFSRRYGLNVRPALFERQLGWIRRSFEMIAPELLLSCAYPAPSAVISFDDGLAGCFENALPILERNRVPSVVFLNMEPVEGGPFWAGLVTYLCDQDGGFGAWAASRLEAARPGGPAFLSVRPEWVEEYLAAADRARILEAVREFHGPFASRRHLEAAAVSGLARFGNHLYNHYNAALLSDADLGSAYRRNREALAGFPCSLDLFSYPFGWPGLCYDDRTNRVLSGEGCRRMFSSYPLANLDRGARVLHRICLDEGVDSEEELAFRVMLPLFKDMLGIRPAAAGRAY